MRRLFLRRRGTSTIQWIVVAAAVFLAILAGVAVLGTATRTQLATDAEVIGDPTKLTAHFGS